MKFKCSVNEIPNAVEYIRKELKNRKVKSKDITKALLTAEEVIRATIDHSESADGEFNVKVNKFLTGTEMRITSKGSSFELDSIRQGISFVDDEESNLVIQNLVSRVMGNNLSVRNRNGLNTSVIKISEFKYKQLIITLFALVLGIGVGFLMKGIMPESFNLAITDKLFAPITTMFLNALKMVVVPLVLFSIASSIACFGDMKALGRIAGKIIGSYMVTSFLAILLGIGVYQLIPIGNPKLQSIVTDTAAVTIENGTAVSTSIKDTLIGIIPSDIITPFQKANMLQIIFIAVMIGLAAGALSNKLKVFKDFLNDGYDVFSKITSMIIKVMPLAVFCSMAKMILSMKTNDLVSVISWVPTIYFGHILMLCVYALMLLVIGRLNPLKFYKKYNPAMITAFSLASSSSTLPTSMQICDKNLGLSKNLYSFALPLGATINMDGSCITQVITAFYMAKIFGIPMSESVIISTILAIFVLSVGAPGVPGGALVCISIILPQIGIPAEAISIIIGLYSLVGMMQCCVNVTGDAVVTLIVGKSEKLIDLDVFNS